MTQKEDKIKDLFASKFENFEPELPELLWEEMYQKLSEQQAHPILVTKKSKVSIRTFLLGVAVAASIALGIFFVLDKDAIAPVTPNVVEELRPTNEINKDIVEPTKEIKKEIFASSETNLVKQNSISNKIKTVVGEDKDSYSKNVVDVLTVSDKSVEKENIIPEDRVVAEETQTSTDTKNNEPAKTTKKTVYSLPQQEDPFAYQNRGNDEEENFSFSLRTNAGALASSTTANSASPILFSSEDRSNTFVRALDSENKDYKMSHNQPVSVGITASKSLGKNLSLETGIMFTYLSSEVKTNSSLKIKEEQKFVYLGIPLYLNYNFYNWGKARFYVSLGMMAQKDIYGKYTSNLQVSKSMEVVPSNSDQVVAYALYSEPSYIKKDIEQPHWQFSSHLTVGASYPIYKRLHVQGSVGGAYYFDADNKYETVYSDRKFQLDLNLGLKFDF